MDLQPWIDEYLTYLKVHGYTNCTQAGRLKHLRALERYVRGQAMDSLEKFTPQHTSAFLASWVRHQPWAKPSTGLQRPSRFRPHHHIALQYSLRSFFRALAPLQVLRMLQHIDRRSRGGKRDFAILLIAASLGVRASEIAALRLEDLNWKQAVVRFPPLKSRHFLHLPLSPPLIKALSDYLRYERPAHSPYRHVFLRLTAPCQPLTARSVALVLARRMQQAGIRASGHQLRHAFASELLRTGTAFSTLQELLGHSHFSSTQVYTKIDLTQLREVADNDAEDY